MSDTKNGTPTYRITATRRKTEQNTATIIIQAALFIVRRLQRGSLMFGCTYSM